MWWMIMRIIGWERRVAAKNKINPSHHKKWLSSRIKWTEYENTHALIKPNRLKSRCSKYLKNNDDNLMTPNNFIYAILFILYCFICLPSYSCPYLKGTILFEKYFVIHLPLLFDYIIFVGKITAQNFLSR